MARQPRNKLLINLLMAAFLVNVLLPFFAVYNLQAAPLTAQSSVGQSLFGGKILLCTSEGLKWVNPSDLRDSPPNDSHNHYKCPLCYFAAHGIKHFAPPHNGYLNAFAFRQQQRYVEIASVAHTKIYARGFLARAPPALS